MSVQPHAGIDPRLLSPHRSVLVGPAVIHTLVCGSLEAGGGALRELQWLVEAYDGEGTPGYFAPPLGCNCGLVADRPDMPPAPPRRVDPVPTKKVDVRPVYFIHAPRSGLIKIGVSANPQARLRELERNAVGEDGLILLATEPGGLKRERELHEKFNDERSRGEWFTESPRLLSYIGAL